MIAARVCAPQARLEEAADEDQADIAEALDELREQLTSTKKEKLSQLQLVETSERALANELGVTLDDAGGGSGMAGGGFGGSGGGSSSIGGGGGVAGGGGGGGVDAGTLAFSRAVASLWKKLETSSIEKLNVGQQDALGVKDLLKLSNEQIDGIAAELKRTAAAKRADALDSELSTLLYDLLMDAASCRKRLNDYTEGLLVQTAQKLDVFKANYLAARKT